MPDNLPPRASPEIPQLGSLLLPAMDLPLRENLMLKLRATSSFQMAHAHDLSTPDWRGLHGLLLSLTTKDNNLQQAMGRYGKGYLNRPHVPRQ